MANQQPVRMVHVRAAALCVELVGRGARCTYNTNYRCEICDWPICGRHEHVHYRRRHPRAI